MKKNNITKKNTPAIKFSDMAADRLADIFAKAIEEGDKNGWQKPWAGSVFVSGGMQPSNVDSGRMYNALNSMILAAACGSEEWKTACFVTIDGCKKHGLSINKTEDEDGELVCVEGIPVLERWSKRYKKCDDNGDPMLDEEGNEITFSKRGKKVRWVWNIDQTNFAEKYPERYKELCDAAAEKPHYKFKNDHDDNWTDAAFDIMLSQPKKFWMVDSVLWGGNRAFFQYNSDFSTTNITLPMAEQFKSKTLYYATAAHEMVHSTKVKLARNYGGHSFGSKGYATEELVAELGSASICHDLGIEKTIDEEHKHYCKSWISALRGSDHREVIGRIITDIMDAVSLWFSHYYKAQEHLGIKPEEQKTNKVAAQHAAADKAAEEAAGVRVVRYSERSIIIKGLTFDQRTALYNDASIGGQPKAVNGHGWCYMIGQTRYDESALRVALSKLGVTAHFDADTTSPEIAAIAAAAAA